jgi:hypothetical protein
VSRLALLYFAIQQHSVVLTTVPTVASVADVKKSSVQAKIHVKPAKRDNFYATSTSRIKRSSLRESLLNPSRLIDHTSRYLLLDSYRQLAQLQRGARQVSNGGDLRTPPDDSLSNPAHTNDARRSLTGVGNVLPSFEDNSPILDEGNVVSGDHLEHLPDAEASTPDDPARLGIDLVAETEHDSCNRSTTGDQHFTNPLVNGPPAFTVDEFGQQCMCWDISSSEVFLTNI